MTSNHHNFDLETGNVHNFDLETGYVHNFDLETGNIPLKLRTIKKNDLLFFCQLWEEYVHYHL